MALERQIFFCLTLNFICWFRNIFYRYDSRVPLNTGFENQNKHEKLVQKTFGDKKKIKKNEFFINILPEQKKTIL